MSDKRAVFVSYSRRDREWLDRLLVHLKPLVRETGVDVWADTRIEPGSPWREEIREAIEKAEVAILLISADFLASDFIMDEELPPLLSRANERGATIIPVLVGPSQFEKNSQLKGFQAVNAPSRTLIELSEAEREVVLVRVADSVAASISSRTQISETSKEGKRGPRGELFTDPDQWSKLMKVGEWSLSDSVIRGEGVYTYLLSERTYGERPYMVIAKIKLSNYQEFSEDESCTANAGIVFGWSTDSGGPTYYNLLLNGKRMLLEEIGFRGDDEFVDFRHLNEGVSFRVEEEVPIALTIRVSSELQVWANNRQVYSLPRPSRMTGRVGLRPWRSRLECRYFEVSYTSWE
ncbi:MAG: toll/interleukin-1 receptor domain-containing protein [Verrucomicrobiota bacterium]